MAFQRVYFVTNRNLSQKVPAEFGGVFGDGGVAGLRFGEAFVDDDGEGDIIVYPEDMLRDATPDTRGSLRLLGNLRTAMIEGAADTLIFIHGYNVSFREALASGAVLARGLAIRNVVVFSWPSDGKMTPFSAYFSDREDARASAPAVARAYLALLDYLTRLPEKDACNQRLHLLCHSMGNYVLRNGLQALRAKEPRRLIRIFDEIVLAAADEDEDAFELDEKLRLLPQLGKRVTVYHNPDDKALIIADTTKGNPDRLGSDGPRLLDALPRKVVTVDCEPVAAQSKRLVEHSYVMDSPTVRADLAETIVGTPLDKFAHRTEIRPERSYRLFAVA